MPYAELPSNERKQERELPQSRETVFYIAFVVRYHHLTTVTNSSENWIQVIRHCYLEPPYKLAMSHVCHDHVLTSILLYIATLKSYVLLNLIT